MTPLTARQNPNGSFTIGRVQPGPYSASAPVLQPVLEVTAEDMASILSGATAPDPPAPASATDDAPAKPRKESD